MRKTSRCAIYTRKSTEDGLEQDFNSLDAQREACEAFVISQTSLGWKVAPGRYDDGGISGATMQRPALQRLLADIATGGIDIVVVYKIDRLTRALMDFARMVDIFDAHDVSFVSVTQAFNTTTSMGRLTLNVLLSFAQFEREVTAERIRDKIAASKKKGMWMGGLAPLGYDIANKQLVVNEAEAVTVRRLFKLYLEARSVRGLKVLADKAGIVTKRRALKDCPARGGKPFSRGNLYQLLSNPVYIGRIAHKGQTYPGLHDPIIDDHIFDAVQARIAAQSVARASPVNVRSLHLLTGLIFDDSGDRLSPSHAVKGKTRYRYYVSHRLMTARRRDGSGWRLPAEELERPILGALDQYLGDERQLIALPGLDGQPPQGWGIILANADRLAGELKAASAARQKELLGSFITRIEINPDQIAIMVSAAKLVTLLVGAPASASNSSIPDEPVIINLAHALKRRGVEARLVIGNGRHRGEHRPPTPDRALITLIARACSWLDQLTTGKAPSITALAKLLNEDRNEISRLLPLAFLAPDIVERIIAGAQPVDLTAEKLRRLGALPREWDKQRALLGFGS